MSNTESNGVTPPIWRADKKGQSETKKQEQSHQGEEQEDEFETELTPEQKRAIEKVSQSDFLNKSNKMVTILAILGEKPVSEISFNEKEDRENIEAFKDLMQDIGMQVKEVPHDKEWVQSSVLISDSNYKSELNEFLELRGEDTKSAEKRRGELFGFPSSAAEAYAYKETSDSSEAILSPWQLFAYSKENIEEERKLTERWKRAIESYAPKLAEEVTKREASAKLFKIKNDYMNVDSKKSEARIDKFYSKFKQTIKKLEQEGKWDYVVGEDANKDLKQLEQVKNKLEALNMENLSEKEQKFCRRALWRWYHHGANKALLDRGDKEEAEQMIQKAIEYQPKSDINRIDQLYYYLIEGDINKAKNLTKNMKEDNQRQAEKIIDKYQEL